MVGEIKKVLPGSKIVAYGDEPGCPGRVVACVAQVEGRFDGFEVTGFAFWHTLLLPSSETPPRGAIELHPRRTTRRRRHESKRLFFLGSNVTLRIPEPSGLHSEE